MLNLPGTIIITISGFLIALGIISIIIMCIVGCIRKQNQDQRANRSQPREVQTQDPNMPSEQDDNNEENHGEAYKTSGLSQAPPPAYRNANKYQTVDLKDINAVQVTGMHNKISTQSVSMVQTWASNLSPPQYLNDSAEAYTAEILNSHMDYSQRTGTDQPLPPPYSSIAKREQEIKREGW